CLPVSLTRCIHLLFKRSLCKLSGKTHATAHARFGAASIGSLPGSIFPIKPKQESIMTRASWITLLATVVLSSFAGATQNSGKVWWAQFRGPNSSGLGEGRPPVNFGPGQNVLWKTPVGPGLSSPVIWEGGIFLTEFDRANKQLSTLCIDRRTGKILWRHTVAPGQIEKAHE